MKSFKQHLHEKGLVDKMLTGALIFGAASGGASLGKVAQNYQQSRQQQTSVVTPRVQNTATAPMVQSKPLVQASQPVAAKPPASVAKPKVAAPNPFENEHVKRLYGAMVAAEHRGVVKDPYSYDKKLYVRTRDDPRRRNKKGEHSTAYGPLQITASTARGFADSKNDYHNSFVSQGKRFMAGHSHPVYGYGGHGDLSGEEHHHNYQQMAVHVMKGKAKELKIDITKPLSDKDLARFAQHWRHGAGSGKQPENWYSDTVSNFYRGK